jgi:hypothetical protein
MFTDEYNRIRRVGSESKSVSQRYGSADPDLYQNVTDPQHCIVENQAVFVIVSLVLKPFRLRYRTFGCPPGQNFIVKVDIDAF